MSSDIATTEKVWLAERHIAVVRLFVVVVNTFVYLFLMTKAGTVPWLAYSIIVAAFLYTAWVLRAEPYRRYVLLSSSYFTSTVDALLIMAWIYATGSFSSPFYLLVYISISAVAFRYDTRETVVAAITYAGAYLALLVAVGQVAGHAAEVATRLAYVGLFAALALMMSREVLLQTRSRVEIAERLSRETQASERRSRFLADSTGTLTRSLDWQDVPKRIASLIVPTLGDHCVVDLVSADGTLQRAAEASVDPEKQGLLRTIAPTSLVAIPLISRDRTLGVLTYGMASENRTHAPEDLKLAEEVARHAALAIDNARLYREAQEAVSVRDKFISIASHELRTPLATLRLQSEGLVRQLDPSRGPPDLEVMRRRLTTIVGQATRLNQLMTQMLDVSRITAGRLDLDLQPTDLGVIAAEVVSRFEDEIPSAGAAISVDLPEPAIVGTWDPVRIDQIVTNLVGNAIKYGAGRPIKVALSAENGHARLVVRDQGIGIEREQQARLFHRFERLAGTDAPGGIGLGLWITRQFVEAMSGSISVDSELGKGATFIIKLPIKTERPA